MNYKRKIKINYKDNIYFNASHELFNELVNLIETHKNFVLHLKGSTNQFGKQLKKPSHQHLLEWIESQLPLLSDHLYQVITKCYWILNGLVDFPICPVCGKQDNFKTKNIIGMRYGYSECCCKACALANPNRGKKILETQRKRASENENYWKDRYQKSKQTCRQRYGVDNISQLESIKKKKEETFIAKYGVKCNLNAPSVVEEIQRTWMRNYGCKHISQSAYYKEHFKATCQTKFGCDHPMHNDEIRRKNRHSYIYDNQSFDSSWELALYIYLSDKKIQFTYQPNDCNFTYQFDGKTKKYFPDFKIGDSYIEIKGDHMIDPQTGIWIPPPYVKKMLSAEAYEHECIHIKLKYECAIKNNVKILRYSECKKYLTYVEQTYGKFYLRQFKKDNVKKA